MTEDIYEKYWDKYFYSFALSIEHNLNLKNYDSYSCFDKDSLKKKLFDEYELLRKNYKSDYKFKEDKKIDRHKISALITLSFINSHPFELEEKSNFPRKVYLSNCFFSLTSGVSVLKSFIIDNLRKISIEDKNFSFEKLKNFEKSDFCYPTIINDDAPTYTEALIRELYFYERRKKLKIDFDNKTCYITLLSHIFYFLESHNLSKYGLLQN